MKHVMLSIIHSLSVMSIEPIIEAKTIIDSEDSFSEGQKERFLTLCDWAIEEKRRWRNGEREV